MRCVSEAGTPGPLGSAIMSAATDSKHSRKRLSRAQGLWLLLLSLLYLHCFGCISPDIPKNDTAR